MAADLSQFYFDPRAAEMAVMFFENYLVHSKGEWAGQPFKLQKWQADEVIRPLFGWKRKSDNTRRFRRAYLELPRKNGKSTMSSGIALYLLFADNEPGAEVYSAAADRDQAAIVFDEAKKMVQASPALDKRAQVLKNSVLYERTNSVYRVLSSDVPTKHGLNVHGVVFDELHAQPNRDLFDVLTTGTGSRRQPMVVMITTAGWNRESICWEQHDYARKVLKGIIDDPEYFAFIAAADEKDDWMDPAVWAKANPSLGVTIKPDYLEAEAKRASMTPAYQNSFRRLHLNQWTQQETRWMPIEKWDKCDLVLDLNLLKNAECYGGLDLSSTSDLASFVLDFPSEPGDERELHQVLARFWIPEENMIERARKDRVPYDAWVRDGLIKTTPGNTIDYGFIVKEIIELSEIYNIREIAFDRWGAFQVSQQLEGAGLTMVGFGQGYQSMSFPTKELLRIVLDEKLAHGGHPVMRWMADNMVVTMDPAGNIKPDKKKSREKIDGIVALIMALDRAIRHLGATDSVYNERGIRYL